MKKSARDHGGPIRRHLAASVAAGAAFAAFSAAPAAKAVLVIGDSNAETTVSPSNAVIKMTQSGTLTVTEPGEIEILLVGGGGGAGGDNSGIANKHGGGGGGGGVVHVRNLSVAVGEYPITIGAGGAINTGARTSGGNTTGFDYTAIGGGPGAYVNGGGGTVGNLGASGGGGSTGGSGTVTGGTAKPYANNLGHDGADAKDTYTSGGGGGAGTAGSGVNGGDGYLCDITGEAVYYAGGGGGGRGWAGPGANGLGGGRENYGGGGRAAGDYTFTSPQAGGPGVAIVRFARKPAKEETAFDDATGGTVTTCRVDGVKYQVHTFAQSGQFAIPHHGHVEVLVVGGGGGGGANVTRSGETSHNNTSVFYGGGGGAGGVVHKSDLFLTNGVYEIVVGAGGPVNAGDATHVNGGTTTAFGLTAFGGGCGAMGYAYNVALSGASGGGGSQTYWQGAGDKAKGAEPVVAYTNAPYFNLGNAGGNARNDAGTGGGGGGAGGASSGVTGGAAYVCSITGADVAYAGGGGGYYWGVQSVAGGGSGSYGGGGNSNGAGGGGVVIVRHPVPQFYATVLSIR